MMNQKTAVYAAVVAHCEITNNKAEVGDNKSLIINALIEGFEANAIELSEKARTKYIGDRKALKSYVGGLLNNWLRKDTRLNGGDKYVTKKPGSRAGASDEVIKNLKALAATLEGDQLEAVNEAIEKRKAEIKTTKTVEIDYDLIPQSLRDQLGLTDDED